MSHFYFFWSAPEAGRIRLVLGYKRSSCVLVPVAYEDDATFFDLGIGRYPAVYCAEDGRIETDTLALLAHADTEWEGASLWAGVVDGPSWTALTAWRERVDPLLQRLYAPVRPAYRDIGLDPEVLGAYKQEVQKRFGATLEELANDRYAAFAQLDQATDFRRLAAYVCARRFYLEAPSALDVLLTADLFPLQVLDGITLPVDLMYYFERVEQACGVSLRDGLSIS